MMCVPAKNGSTSFRLSVMPDLNRRAIGPDFVKKAHEQGIGLFSPDKAASFGLKMYMAVRHPVERFASLWRDLQRKSVIHLIAIRDISPTALMDLAEQYPDGNDHWIRQSDYWLPEVEPIPYDQFLKRMGLPFCWEHKSQPINRQMPEDRILAHYEKDLELWNACSS